MLMHLHSDETDLDVIGSALVGTPGIIIGHNNYYAWGITNV